MAHHVAEYEQYKRIKLLGQGSFGKAFLAECVSDGVLCVIKQVDLSTMNDQEKKDTLKEVKILESLNHPNIIRFREVYKTKKGKLCIVMDYADGGDLSGRIKDQKRQPFPENQVLDWFTQICLALKHVHDRKIIHRDLKAQNIFLTKANIIKLGDFGIARVLSHTHDNAKTMIGTPYYLSPEIINGKSCCLIRIMCIKTTFRSTKPSYACYEIIKGQYSSIPNQFSRDLKNLVGTLLQIDSYKRPSINEVLKYPLLQQRIQNFLSKTVKIQEFSHTILHKQQFVKEQMKLENIKSVENEAPIPKSFLKEKEEEKEKVDVVQKQPRQYNNLVSPAKDQKVKIPESNQPLKSPQGVHERLHLNKNVNSPARPSTKDQKVAEVKSVPKIVAQPKPFIARSPEEKKDNWLRPDSQQNRVSSKSDEKDSNKKDQIPDLWDIPNNEMHSEKDLRVQDKKDLMVIGAKNILNPPKSANSSNQQEPAVKQQIQQNQANRVQSAKKNNGVLGGGFAMKNAPAVSKNSKDVVKKSNNTPVVQPSIKKPIVEQPVAAVGLDKKDRDLAQKRLAEARKKQEAERLKKEKKNTEEAERHKAAMNQKSGAQKDRDARRKEMMNDVRNKIQEVFKKIETYEVQTGTGSGVDNMKNHEEEKVNVVHGVKEGKVQTPLEVKGIQFKGEAKAQMIQNHDPNEFLERTDLSDEDDDFKVEIYKPDTNFILNHNNSAYVEQEQYIKTNTDNSNEGFENHLVTDELRAFEAASNSSKGQSEKSEKKIPSTSDAGAIFETDQDIPIDKDEEEGEEEDPFITKLEREVTKLEENEIIDPKDLEHLHDITDLIEELKIVNTKIEEDNEEVVKVSSNELDQEDRDDMSDLTFTKSEEDQNEILESNEEVTGTLLESSKLQSLRMKLEEMMSPDTFLQTYRVAKNLLQKYTLDELGGKYGEDNYARLFPFLSEEGLKKHLEFVFTYVLCEKQAEQSDF